MLSREAPWWVGAFGADYVAVYAHRDEAAAAREVAFAVDVLGLAAGDRVLDAGCGAGRHTRALASRGLRAVGLDRSRALLGLAVGRKGAARHLHGDVRALPFRTGTFDGVVSFFTSFGYFDGAGDRAHAGELHRVLRPGGGLLLDFLNAPRVQASLVPSSVRQVGARAIREERAIRDGRVEKQVTVTEGDQLVAAWTESVRLYGHQELAALLGDAGFEVTRAYASLSGGAWEASSDRLVLRAVAS